MCVVLLSSAVGSSTVGDESTMYLCNIRKYEPSDTASCLGRLKISESNLMLFVTGTANLVLFCLELPTIILQNQVPKGMKKSEALMQMEATIKKYTSEIFLTEDDLYDVEKKQPPR
jgi:hypothetical protein